MLNRSTRRSPASLALAAVAVLAAGACTHAVDSPVTTQQQDQYAALWGCSSLEGRITCGAPIAAQGEESNAYACQVEDFGDSSRCPPNASLGSFKDVLERHGLWEEFNELPWACLRTGADQRHCARDMERAGLLSDEEADAVGEELDEAQGGGEIPGEGDGMAPSEDGTPPADDATPPTDDPADEPSDEPGSDGPPAGAEVPPPTVPGDCTVPSWEGYFCGLANYSYQELGISFPCDLFDGLADFNQLAMESAAEVPNPEAPSCHDSEWEMRDNAWMDAVLAGCTDLNDPILVMCQQAANYAPQTGMCSPTGSW